VEAKDEAKHPIIHRTALLATLETKHYLAQNVSAEVEKSYSNLQKTIILFLVRMQSWRTDLPPT